MDPHAHQSPQPPTTLAPTTVRRVKAFVFLTVFIDFLGLGILIPVLPFLVKRFNEDAIAVGLLSAAFALSQFVATPALGALSDRVGRRTVLIISLIGSALGYLVFGLAGGLAVMMVGRIIDGVTGANISTAQAALADVTPEARRSRAFALIGVAMTLGFVLGPAVGGILGEKAGLGVPVFVACALSLSAGVLAFFGLPETLPEERRAKQPLGLARLNPLAPLAFAPSSKSVWWVIAALVVASIPFTALSTNFGVYLDRVYSIDASGAAMLFTWMGVVLALVQGVIVRNLSGRVSDHAMAAVGLALLGAGFVACAAAPAAWALYVGIALVAAGSGLSTPTLTSIISRSAGEGRLGAALGFTTGLLSLTRVAGPLMAGLAFDRVSPSSVYWGGAVGVAAGLALLLAGGRSAKRAAERVTAPPAPASHSTPPATAAELPTC